MKCKVMEERVGGTTDLGSTGKLQTGKRLARRQHRGAPACLNAGPPALWRGQTPSPDAFGESRVHEHEHGWVWGLSHSKLGFLGY